MSAQRNSPLEPSSRFQGRNRHYHRTNREQDVTWDDWIGDKKKSPTRQRIEKALMTVAVVVTGIGLIAGAFTVVSVVMKKVLGTVSR